MSNDNFSFFQQFSSKLGISDNNIIQKALEYLRKLQLKSMRLSEPQKVILCLDIASTNIGTHFDREKALKLLGIKQNVYQTSRFSVLKLLQIEKSVHEICVQLGCEHMSKFADEILKKYKETDQIERDFSHPQYLVAAVATACSIKNVKISKDDSFTISNLKRRQWKQLNDEFMKFAENNFKTEATIKRIKKRGIEMMNAIEEKVQDMEQKKEDKQIQKQEVVVESYEAWRKRILEEAYEHVKKK